MAVVSLPQPAEPYLAAYRAFAANGASRAPAWLRELHEAGITRFGELGFPSTKQEEWRFTSVAPLAETPFELARPAPAAVPELRDIEPFLLGEAAPHRLVFVNGRFSERLSRLEGFPAGVRVASLAAALAHEPELVRAHLGRYAGYADHPFRALNTAFIADGALVYVPRGLALEEPVQVLYLAVPEAGPFVVHPRNLVVVEPGGRVAVVETYASAGEGVYWTNAVTEIAVGDGARADCYRVQRESERAYHVATTHAHQGRDSTVNLHVVAFGGALARHDLRLVLDGENGFGILNGLYLLRGRQHVDHHTVIDHARPHCESHEYFNGVLDGAARGVFNGRIIVRPGAQRTDSKQTNHNLLLSGEAHADSQPQLEIYADDVKCTHGSTTGPLDERQLFYVKSRGLDPAEARRLLTYGFAAEILARMEVAPLRRQLDRIVRGRVWA
ncbi:MAG TPA: Fe-S cluster assembly protein SufD [Gemmatimonadales bacterium]|nr:Fe-S cluster assembly protein SufD [Gemmatimonadales bacterium]